MTQTDIRPIDILCTYLEKTHAIKVSWRPDLGMSVSPSSLPGARWGSDGMSWTIPALSAHLLLPYFRSQFPEQRVSFDKLAANLIYEQLEKETATSALALAEDGDVPDVLSVTLKPFQRAALAYLLRGTPRKVLALPTGRGKTAVACAYAKIRRARTLWITKPGLVINLTREIRKLTNDKAVLLMGTSPDSHHIDALLDPTIQHFIITYDSLSRSLLEQKNEEGHVEFASSLWALTLTKFGKFDLCVTDEAHNIRNRATGRWKVLSMLREIPSFLFLTATPFVNNGLDMFSLLTLLDKKTFGSEAEFTRAYLSADGKRIMAPKQFQKDLLPYVFHRSKADTIKDLPPTIRQNHYIALSSDWKEKYDAVMRGIYEDMKGQTYDVPDMFLAQFNRFRQVASQAKVEHTAELAMQLEENGEKCLVFTTFKESAYALAKELSCDAITGDVAQSDRMRMVDEFTNNPNVKHLVLMMQVGGTGLNLSAASAILFNDLWYTHELHTQSEGRAEGRLNNPHSCLIYYVSVENTVDQFLMELIKQKQELDEVGAHGIKVYASEQMSLQREFVRYVMEHRG